MEQAPEPEDFVKEAAEEAPTPPKAKYPIQLSEVDTLRLQKSAAQLAYLTTAGQLRQTQMTTELQEINRQCRLAQEKFDAAAEQIEKDYGVNPKEVNITEEGLITGPRHNGTGSPNGMPHRMGG
jgi:hypothetical protein